MGDTWLLHGATARGPTMTPYASSDRLCRICLLIAAIGLAALTLAQPGSATATPLVLTSNAKVAWVDTVDRYAVVPCTPCPPWAGLRVLA